jgi:hypothetical protein
MKHGVTRMSTLPGSDSVASCEACSASIYREHIDRGLAGRWAGQLLCPHCLAEKRGGGDLEHLSQADETEAAAPPGRSSTHTGLANLSEIDTMQYKRPLLPAGRGATRMRVFHCKLSEGPLMQLNKQINEWADAHPDVEIKFATTTLGTWEGRHAEQHIIMSVYY